jgi:hypothetical protein
MQPTAQPGGRKHPIPAGVQLGTLELCQTQLSQVGTTGNVTSLFICFKHNKVQDALDTKLKLQMSCCIAFRCLYVCRLNTLDVPDPGSTGALHKAGSVSQLFGEQMRRGESTPQVCTVHKTSVILCLYIVGIAVVWLTVLKTRCEVTAGNVWDCKSHHFLYKNRSLFTSFSSIWI